jgi:hypothetical protein
MSTLLKCASSLRGEPVIEKFRGTRNVQTVAKFKEKIIALTRKNHVEKILFQPAEELFPDPAKYKKDDATEQRKYEKITDKAAEAYALVKEYFQEDSSAWNSVILRANETGHLDILWKLFLEKYDNPVTKAGAVRLIRSYYEKATSQNILGLFTTFTEHYFNTPKRLPQQTPAEPITTGGANGIASMPWA